MAVPVHMVHGIHLVHTHPWCASWASGLPFDSPFAPRGDPLGVPFPVFPPFPLSTSDSAESGGNASRRSLTGAHHVMYSAL